jgi:hypothetical protein
MDKHKVKVFKGTPEDVEKLANVWLESAFTGNENIDFVTQTSCVIENNDGSIVGGIVRAYDYTVYATEE